MFEKCLALKLMFKTAPSYSQASLRKVSKAASGISFKRRMVIFLGTIKRVAKGKI